MTRLAVFSHKPCWTSKASASGFATDGGFPFHMRAIAELFDETRVVVPVRPSGTQPGELPLVGPSLQIVPLRMPRGAGLRRKLDMPFWLVSSFPVLVRETLRADAVHVPIPGDVGTFGMLLAFVLGKPLFVRHCGNWLAPKTVAEHFWKWFMEKYAGGRNVMLATGGGSERPSERNPDIEWIFSTSLRQSELSQFGRARRHPSDRVRLLIACRQDPEKGTGTVIESLPVIQAFSAGVSLDVVGDGPALDDFRQLANKLGVADRVTFHGKVDHEGVMKLMSRADLFCYPTTASEGFPKVVLEALACGLPVVTTPVSVLPQLLGSGCGTLIEAATAVAVAEGVRECLSTAERYETMSRQALATAGQYSLERWRDTIGKKLRQRWSPLAVRV